VSATKGPSVELLRKVALFMARLQGCNCNPDFTVRELAPGVNYSETLHDSWCGHPSMRKGRDA
jgi:hypothetical protein